MSDKDPAPLELTARAKINLALHVTGKRADGYHLLDSLVAFTRFGDELTISPAQETFLENSGPFAGELGNGDDNLIIRAGKLLQNMTAKSLPSVRFQLNKNLPIASGIGGGSANAAAALKGLNNFWDLNYSQQELAEIGLKLGADVPVCLLSKACRMQGIGEIITPVPSLPSLPILLVNPGIGVSTPQIFNKLGLKKGGTAGDGLAGFPSGNTQQDWIDWLKNARNDLQQAAFYQVGEIASVLETLTELDGCQLARMSGSGATCFAIFESAVHLDIAATALQKARPGWWTVPTMTIS